MNKQSKRFSIFVMLLFSVWSVPAIAAEKDVAGEITSLLAEQDAAWNRGDLEGFMSLYDDSGQLVFIGSSGAVRDRSVLQERYEKKYRNGDADFGKLHFTELEVEELAPGLARAWGRWHLQQKQESYSGWFSLLLKRKPEGWRIIHDHSS